MTTTQAGNNNEFVSDTKCFSSYGKGWKLVLASFLPLLAVTVIYAVIRAPVDASNNAEDGSGGLGLLVIPYGIFLAGPIGMSTSRVFLRAARKKKLRVADMFAVFQRNYWNAVAAGLLKFIIIVVGFLLLIVPGIIFAVRLAFVEYLVIDRKMDAMEAFRESWAMTKGHSWTIFGMSLLAIPIIIVGLLLLIVGVFVSCMWIGAAFAVLYHSVCLEKETEQTESAEALPATEGPAA